ncbi:MAG: type I glyceraldehyde-3-phosphate dehydrogenase [Candidatus Pacearchaeota archaeon]
MNSNQKPKIAVNGFGRIGRIVFKLLVSKGYNVVAINDLADKENLAYLLKHDSVYGNYEKQVSTEKENLIVGNKKFKVFNEKDPSKLPWKKLGIDIVIESSGAFRSYKKSSKHLKAGAKKVIITAPAKDPDKTIVPGVNHNELTKNDKIVSVASCTTNALSPVAKILEENFGIENAFMNTVHGYTASQNLVDGPKENKVRRGRAAALNIVPTTSGATNATSKAVPELEGKMNGLALRVPTPTGSIVDLTAQMKTHTTTEKINKTLKKASQKELKGILEFSEEPLVSTDIVGNPHSSIVDGLSTQVQGNLVKILAWYDNEYGYCNRITDVLNSISKGGGKARKSRS